MRYINSGLQKMYIAMNRFKVILGRETDFEAIWKKRNTFLENVPGFIKFNLIKGSVQKDHALYASHSSWNSYKDFENWTKSDEFRKAHAGAGKHVSIYLEHPIFEGFEVIV